MKKIQQTNLDQTGTAIYILPSGDRKYIPLYSLRPIEEAHDIEDSMNHNRLEPIRLENVYLTNNLMPTKIEDIIENYRKSHLNLPEDYMEELVSGFPYILGGEEPDFKIGFYK